MPSWKKVILSGSDASLNSLDVTTDVTITGSLSLSGSLIDYTGNPGTSGQIILSTGTGIEWAPNIAESAQDLIITGKNVTLSTINKGTPVFFTGSGTMGNLVGVIPADAGDPTLMPAGGVLAETLAAGAEGGVYIYGYINGVNTSAFNAGDDVFVAVGGGYTNVKPTGSALIQKLGNIEKVNPTNGSGVIQGPSWYNDLPNVQPGYTWVGDSDSVPQAVSTASLFVTSASYAITSTSASHALNADNAISSSYSLTATSASHALDADNAISSSHALDADNAISSSHTLVSDTSISASHALNADNAISSSHALNADNTISSSYSLTTTSASHAIFADTASFLPSTTNLNINSISASSAVFQSASIGYLQTVTGSAIIIGQEFIILNTDTPAARYAGIVVIDSGSVGVTASLVYDSVSNDWKFFHEDAGTSDYSNVIFGPLGTDPANTPELPANYIVKADSDGHGHHITSSNLYDDGTAVSISSPLKITGYLQNTNSGFISYTFNSGSTIGTLASNQVLFTIGSGTYESVTMNYVIFDSTKSNKRAGTLRGTWDDDTTAIVFDETSTTDIGDTAGFTLDMVNNGSGTISVRATNNLGGSMTIIYEYKLLGDI
jgi:hypothetical protein